MKNNKRYRFIHALMRGNLLLGIILFCGCAEDEQNGDGEKLESKTALQIKAIAGANVPEWQEQSSIGIFVQVPNVDSCAIYNRECWIPKLQNGLLHPVDNHPLVYPETAGIDIIAYHPFQEDLVNYEYLLSLLDQANLLTQPLLYVRQHCKQKEEDVVELEFNHVLCKVSLNFTAEDATGRLILASLAENNVALENLPTTARLSLLDGSLVPEGQKGNLFPLKSFLPEENADVTFSAVVLPQRVEAGNKCSIVFVVDGVEYRAEIENAVNWKPGMHYSYPVSVSVEGIEIGKAEFKNWQKIEHGVLNEKVGDDWYPGMDYAPYPGMPEVASHESVHVIVCDADSHGAKIMEVLNNRAWAWNINTTDRKNWKQCFFPTHPDIELYLTETYDDPNPDYLPCDIFSASTSGDDLAGAKRDLEKMLDKTKFPEFPLVITSAGNGSNTFTQEAWDFCMEHGTLNWDKVVEIKDWEPDENGNWSPEQAAWYKPGDVNAAYVVQDPDGYGHAKDYIIVGADNGGGNKPGPILKERWVCTYYIFGIFDRKTDGTSFSTPYVAKIAAEIKRRAPHYTNDEIAQLIFTTCDDLGEPGCDEVYGWGRMNPSKIWAELVKRGL